MEERLADDRHSIIRRLWEAKIARLLIFKYRYAMSVSLKRRIVVFTWIRFEWQVSFVPIITKLKLNIAGHVLYAIIMEDNCLKR